MKIFEYDTEFEAVKLMCQTHDKIILEEKEKKIKNHEDIKS